MRHTPSPMADVAAAVPALAPLATITVRLHPRHGNPLPQDSHVGGTVVWPAERPWPTCTAHRTDLVPVLQLRRLDIPELPFPSGTDLFHLLWCPQDHSDSSYAPLERVFWWPSAVSLRPVEPPPPAGADSDYLPRPCVVHPERVVEYPHISELPDALQEALASNRAIQEAADRFSLGEADTLYQYCLSVADGMKVGGHVNWIQEPETPACPAGHRMSHLLTIASAEFDGGTWHRWLAEEERHVWGAPYLDRSAVQSAPGLMLGDMGCLFLFTCLTCTDRPVSSVFQCS